MSVGPFDENWVDEAKMLAYNEAKRRAYNEAKMREEIRTTPWLDNPFASKQSPPPTQPAKPKPLNPKVLLCT